MKALGDRVYTVGRGNIRMALFGPAVTATRSLKEIKLGRHTSWTLLEVTRAEIAPQSVGDKK